MFYSPFDDSPVSFSAMIWAGVLLFARLTYLSKFFDLIYILLYFVFEMSDLLILFHLLKIVGVLNLFEFRQLSSTVVKNHLLNLPLDA